LIKYNQFGYLFQQDQVKIMPITPIGTMAIPRGERSRPLLIQNLLLLVTLCLLTANSSGYEASYDYPRNLDIVDIFRRGSQRGGGDVQDALAVNSWRQPPTWNGTLYEDWIAHSRRSTNSHSVDPFSPNIALPWSCETNVVWQDLGPHHFPRYLRSVQCGQGSCWYGNYRCLPKTFQLKVLCLSSSGCSGSSDEVPTELKPRWMFRTVSVTSACECGRS